MSHKYNIVMKSTYQQEYYPQQPLSRVTPGDGITVNGL